MAQLLHKLENNEAVLLMYLADELPAEDRRELEQLLSSDAVMRAELESLTSIYGTTMDGLRQLDSAEPLRSADELMISRTAALMRRQVVEQTLKPVPAPVSQGRRVRWWHPFMVAAAASIAFLVWWGYTPERTPSNRPQPGWVRLPVMPGDDLAQIDPSQRELDPAERHAVALVGEDEGRIGSALWLPSEERP